MDDLGMGPQVDDQEVEDEWDLLGGGLGGSMGA